MICRKAGKTFLKQGEDFSGNEIHKKPNYDILSSGVGWTMRGRALLESEICRMTENIRDCEISYFIQMTVDFISRSSKFVQGKMVWKHYQQEMLEDLKNIIFEIFCTPSIFISLDQTNI